MKRICQALRQRPGVAIASSIWQISGIDGSYQADRMNCILLWRCDRDRAAGSHGARLAADTRRAGVLNRACLPSDVIAFVVFCHLRYRLTEGTRRIDQIFFTTLLRLAGDICANGKRIGSILRTSHRRHERGLPDCRARSELRNQSGRCL